MVITQPSHSNTGLFSPVFRCHLNTRPFANRTTFNHLNTRLVRYSDGYCTFNIFRRSKLQIKFKFDLLIVYYFLLAAIQACSWWAGRSSPLPWPRWADTRLRRGQGSLQPGQTFRSSSSLSSQPARPTGPKTAASSRWWRRPVVCQSSQSRQPDRDSAHAIMGSFVLDKQFNFLHVIVIFFGRLKKTLGENKPRKKV